MTKFFTDFCLLPTFFLLIRYLEKPNEKNPKFNVGDHVRISMYKNVFAKGYAPNWSEEIFIVDKVKYTVPWTYEINDLNGEKTIGSFYEKELQNKMSQCFPRYGGSKKDVKVELDLSNYATKKDLKDITHVDTSSYASKTNLAALKAEIDKIDTDKLKQCLMIWLN